ADHIHMLLEIPPKMSVSSFMGYLKGKSSLMLYEQFGDLKFKYRNREFWCRGYYVDTVGKNTATQGTSLKRIKWESSYQSLIRAARLRAVSNESSSVLPSSMPIRNPRKPPIVWASSSLLAPALSIDTSLSASLPGSER
ncbi:transposase IS200-family protein, partial [Salmonella enterica subsp. enterica serovar Norwich str. CFSAN001077]